MTMYESGGGLRERKGGFTSLVLPPVSELLIRAEKVCDGAVHVLREATLALLGPALEVLELMLVGAGSCEDDIFENRSDHCRLQYVR